MGDGLLSSELVVGCRDKSASVSEAVYATVVGGMEQLMARFEQSLAVGEADTRLSR